MMFFFFNDTATTEIYTFPYTTLFRSDVEWSAEDGTRSEMDYLCRIVEAVIKAGATTVNIPDTVGDRKSTRLNSSHSSISYAVFCLKKKKRIIPINEIITTHLLVTDKR